MAALASTPTTLNAAEPLIEAPSALDHFIDNAVITAPPEEPEGIEAMISRIAEEVGVASTTLYNLVKFESEFNPNAKGDGGCSLGLTQQNICANTHITKEQALDPEWSLRYAASDILNDREHRYMVCNCWGYIKANFVKGLPNTANLYPNGNAQIGAVAIFSYKGVKHYAYVTGLSKSGFSVREANFKPCVVGERFISYSDAALLGFWVSTGA